MKLYGWNEMTERGQGRRLLAQAAKEVWGFDRLPEIAAASGGKLYFPGYPACHFNLSHSGSLVLCGLSEQPIGVDIQIIKPTWKEGLPRRVCSEDELIWLERQADCRKAFGLLWAMKESKVKHSGEGLRNDLRAIRVPLPGPGEDLCALDGLWFRWYTGENWAACVCCCDVPPEKIFWIEKKELAPLDESGII